MSEVSYVSVSYTHLFLREMCCRSVKIENKDKLLLLLNKQDSPLSTIDVSIFQSVLLQYLLMSKDESIGLRIGEQHHVCIHGALGQAVISAGTLGDGLKLFVKYFQLLTDVMTLTWEETDKGMLVGLRAHPRLQEKSNIEVFWYEVIMLSLQSVLEFFTGRQIQDSFFALPYPPPGYDTQYTQYFHSPVAFNQSQGGVLVPKDYLASVGVCGHEETYEMASRRCERLKNMMDRTHCFREAVEQLIVQDMGIYCNLKNVSKHFNISTRTLTRKLKEEDSSFQDILTTLRKESAQHLLIYSDKTIEDIALTLGYQDAGNFARAFRRWFGETPALYREARAATKVIKPKEEVVKT